MIQADGIETQNGSYCATVLQDSDPQPLTVSKTQTAEIGNSNTMVSITATGEKYHAYGCQYITGKNNLTVLSVEEAIRKGFEPCAVCNPDKFLH